MAKPKVSWIVPVHNQEEYVVESIYSILGQTFEDFELIVINDASTDNTHDLVAALSDKRIKIINNNINVGVSKSLNTGIESSNGQYIARMDGDDICTPDRLEKQVEFMDLNPEIAVCGSHIEILGGTHRIVKRPLGSQAIKCFLLAGPPFSHPSVMLRKSLLQEHNLYYDESFSTAQDYELWSRILQIAPGWNLDEVLLKHRLHDGQVSVTKLAEQDCNADRVRQKVIKSLGIDADACQFEMHARLFRNTLETGNANIEWSISWIDNLIEKNSEANVFDAKALNEFLRLSLKHYIDKCESSDVKIDPRLSGKIYGNRFANFFGRYPFLARFLGSVIK